MPRTLLEAVKDVLAEPDVITLTLTKYDPVTGEPTTKEDMEITAYPLTYAEFLEGYLLMPEEVKWTEEEMLRYQETGDLPDKKLSRGGEVAAFKHSMFILGAALKKALPDEAAEIIKSIVADVRIFFAFKPLADTVWLNSLPIDHLVKKKPLA